MRKLHKAVLQQVFPFLLLLVGAGQLVGQAGDFKEALGPVLLRANSCLEAEDGDCLEAEVEKAVALCVEHGAYAVALDSARSLLNWYYYLQGDLLTVEALADENEAFVNRYSGKFSSDEEEERLRDELIITKAWIAGEMGDVATRRSENERLFEEVRNRPGDHEEIKLDLLKRITADYLALRDYDLAIEYVAKTRRLYRQHPELDTRGTHFESLLDLYEANAHLMLEDYRRAGNLYRSARNRILQKQDYSATNLQGRLGRAHQGIGRAALGLKDFDAARENLEQAVAVDVANKWGPAAPYYYLGEVEQAAGNFEAAEAFYRRSLGDEVNVEQVSPQRSRTLRGLSKVYRKRGRSDLALTALQQALTALYPRFADGAPCDNPDNIDLIHAKRELLSVLLDKARIQTDQAVGNPEELNCALETHQLAVQTLNHLKEGLDSDRVRSKFIASNYEVFELGVDIALSLGKADLALEMAEQSRSNQLLSAVLSTRLPENMIADTVRERERKIKLQLEMARQRLAVDAADSAAIQEASEARLLLDGHYRDLRQNSPEYYELLRRVDADNYEVIKGDVDANEVMLSFFIGDEQSYGFVIRPGREVEVFSIGEGRRRLSTLVSELLRAVYYGRPEANAMELDARGRVPRSKAEADALFARRAHDLFQLLMEPALNGLEPGKDRLLIVPDGPLSYLPFDALLQEEVPEEEIGIYGNSSYGYVARQFETSYAYSATLHRLMKEQQLPSDQSGVLLFHDYDFARQSGTIRQAFAEQGYSSAYVEVLGQEGSVDALVNKGKDHQIVHFSVHGVINGNDPALSYLRLRSSDRERPNDSLLSLSRLYALELPVELVFTSACNAGVGKLYYGEGVMSLARGFAHAGAKSIVTTLWAVSDGASNQLMADFYRELGGGARKETALFRAKREMLGRTEYAHPYYWSGFIPLGDMSPISNPQSVNWWSVILGGLLVLVAIVSWNLLWRSRQ